MYFMCTVRGRVLQFVGGFVYASRQGFYINSRALVKKLPRSLSLSVVFHARNAKHNDDGMNDVFAQVKEAALLAAAV